MSKLFSPITIRGQQIKNRAFVSPMCQYSAEGKNGHPTSWHMAHLGSRAVGGAGLVMFEATAVTPTGRITPWDLGLWSDEHIDSFKPIVELVESQGALPCIQLAHAGRKASHDRPWVGGKALMELEGGWNVVGPSPIPYDDNDLIPQQLSVDQIDDIIKSFELAAVRSVNAGFKAIELHFAHGYLVSEFLSPLSNQRHDEYGGTFENRTRIALQIIDATRNGVPDDMPLFVRISTTEYVETGWNIDDSILFANLLSQHGVDLIDCSSGGNSHLQKLDPSPGYQVAFSEAIRSHANILTGAVGLITSPQQAETILENGQADVILMGRELLRNPYWPINAQRELDGSISWVNQYHRA